MNDKRDLVSQPFLLGLTENASSPVLVSLASSNSQNFGPVSAAYAELAGRGVLSADPAQVDAARLLDRVLTGLAASRPKGLFARLFDKPEPVQGLYLHGEVGRGKTMLMDLFFSAAPTPAKRRVHFDEFMDEVHTAIADPSAWVRVVR